MKTHWSDHRLIFLAVVLTILCGCSRPADTVTGTVTFRDKPLGIGSVILYCEDQQIIHGLISPEGTYTIPNVPRGQVRVTIRTPSRQRELWRQQTPTWPVINGPVVPGSNPSIKPSPTTIIPTRYEVPEESGLTVTVVSGVTVFDINLVR